MHSIKETNQTCDVWASKNRAHRDREEFKAMQKTGKPQKRAGGSPGNDESLTISPQVPEGGEPLPYGRNGCASRPIDFPQPPTDKARIGGNAGNCAKSMMEDPETKNQGVSYTRTAVRLGQKKMDTIERDEVTITRPNESGTTSESRCSVPEDAGKTASQIPSQGEERESGARKGHSGPARP